MQFTEVVEIGEGGAATALVGHQYDEAILVGHTRERVQNECLQPAQHGGVGPDAQRERQHYDGGEARNLAKLAECVTDVGEHGVGVVHHACKEGANHRRTSYLLAGNG